MYYELLKAKFDKDMAYLMAKYSQDLSQLPVWGFQWLILIVNLKGLGMCA